MNEHLVAVCGLYCGACGLYRATKDDNEHSEEIKRATSERWGVSEDEVGCEGCLGGGMLTPYCRACRMRACAEDKAGVSRCSDCVDFPCHMVTDFNSDGARHHAEVLDNLREIQKIGAEEWAAAQEKRWRCPKCDVQVDWYARTCYSCGESQPYRLPKLPSDEA